MAHPLAQSPPGYPVKPSIVVPWAVPAQGGGGGGTRARRPAAADLRYTGTTAASAFAAQSRAHSWGAPADPVFFTASFPDVATGSARPTFPLHCPLVRRSVPSLYLLLRHLTSGSPRPCGMYHVLKRCLFSVPRSNHEMVSAAAARPIRDQSGEVESGTRRCV